MSRIIKFVVLISSVINGGYSITVNKGNGPLDFIWNLTRFAVQSRQFGNYPIMPLATGENIFEAISSIAQNDDHLCIPKLLCEVTAGTLSYGRQAILPAFNMDSLLGVLSTFETISPIVLFGRAALLGYSSKGDSYSCSRAYPRCPNDPDLLLNYLNNHNGGFFRFFNGLPNQESNSEIVGFDGQHYGFVSRTQPSKKRRYDAQRRILNGIIKPNGFLYFPFEESGSYRGGRKLIFPNNGNDDNFLDIQKPLPNHVPSPTIFPVRTGTGSLVIDNFDDSEYYRSKDFIKFI